MSEYVAVISLPTRAATYEEYSNIRNTASTYGVISAALVERNADGTYDIPENTDGTTGTGTLSGSLIGMLVGVLGGPVGLLLGLSVGTATGALVDVSNLDDSDDVISLFAQQLPPGNNAIIVQTEEPTTDALDAQVARAGGRIVRRPLDEVISELEAQQDAADAAAKAARKAAHEQKKQERQEKNEDRIAELKAKFSRD
ncbi:DUF1269 domain-containing protein [Tsukamurella pulmonis]|uniref:DUF1269 domain-containing protein n=1 Tax=Tsukamurella pulmonis TaxID=47312 RepID=UPI0008392CB8|nr:DUF1269 domain-containing protein [Tsukamurella pulmonis]RDH10005.1 DUF1269 domain-containing protein [Tsukamurella pulmonis]